MAEILTYAAFYAGWPKAWAAEGVRIVRDNQVELLLAVGGGFASIAADKLLFLAVVGMEDVFFRIGGIVHGVL